MAGYYFDTSALLKRYAQETGTAWVLQVTDSSAGHHLYTVRLTGPELIAGLFRKVRMGALAQADAQQVAASFRLDWQQQYEVIELTPAIADEAMRLAEAHGLRGYDAVHLAAALAVAAIRRAAQASPLIFVTADDDQLQAAQAEGLASENPNVYP